VPLLIERNTVKLLRFPFSLLLMPVFILALSQAENSILANAVISFLIIHVLVYPASNGYNSYVDKDESPVGGLEKPPQPTKQLFWITLIMDIAAVLFSAIFINKLFSACILLYMLASRAYSSPKIRLKKYPILGFLTVFIFQGAFTYLMCTVGITGAAFNFTDAGIYILAASSFQIAGAYPLTQIYQHEQDLKDGVKTLSYQLGYIGTFIFSIAMFIICNIFYYLYFNSINQLNSFMLIQLFFIPIIIYFSYWFYKVIQNTSEANFRNTMRMNYISAICMNSCFILLLIFDKL
jgi:4-hydroxybenzoate polyprenyltransferase